jgi:hypothetical protein
MKYIIAITHTILLVAIPLIMMPFLQWYKREWLEPNTDMGGIYILLILLSIGFFFLTLIKWILAIKNKDIKDL